MVAARVVSSVVQRQVKYVTPVAPTAADGLVAEVYRQATDEMRLVVPPLLLHSPAPRTLAAYWMLMREPLMTGGAVDRLAKEAVASAVSVANICPYCVDMHSTGMYDLSTEHDAEAIVADRVEDIVDPRVRTLAGWARVAHQPAAFPAFDLTLTPAERAELVGVVVAFHYLGRMVNVFLSSFLLPPQLGSRAKRRMKRGVSRLLHPILREEHPAGRSLPLLPAADLPPEAGWAVGSEAVAGAVARANAAFTAAGERSVPPRVRALVAAHLDTWQGVDTGLSREWCERAIVDLPEPDRSAGRLALLAAFASYQVDEETIAEFRAWHEGDAVLVETVAWASFATALAVGRRHLR
ncbi:MULTISPECIES: carboxymuconolactone decarboxylase family protein [Micromonospora]|uniref:carboxymuconolactone decarboxylase family protein n=1 Tax=Micromonospora TaxID=1873 RepID=UPI001EE8A463|nr:MULTISPECIES: carboxymuconolactone decarboxylase family protein [Micromonospora]MCG5449710.1 carboxymuconolactone decarboxylase family protein [Micromonospora hortensis]MCX5121856.1 carboxymuconolactone decarboxylase family protein [Micromonospora sp. NBC_00362]WTI06177.1 carboxymuconolactone decarboxylase family protein [Micromonospora sp. NBC_00821]